MSGEIASRFLATRRFTEQICRPLAIEDFVVQAMPDASPTRWHLAHSTWFFETFVLARWQSGLSTILGRFSVSVQLVLQQRRRAIPAGPAWAVDAADRRGSFFISAGRGSADERIAGDPRRCGTVAGRRARNPTRAAASGIDPDRPQISAQLQPARARLSRIGHKARPMPGKKPAGNRFPAALSRSDTAARNFPSTTNDRGTRFCFSRSN